MKKILLKVQGINVISDYMVKEMELSEVDLSSYDKIIYVNTEKEFDKVLNALPSFLKTEVYVRRQNTKKSYDRSEVYTKLKWVDYAVDIWAFFVDRGIYRAVTNKIRQKVDKYRKEGYSVDIFGHSLGTLIALHSGADVNNFFCTNSPLGIANPILRRMIHWHFSGIKKPLSTNNTIIAWGTEDFVSRETDKEVIDLLRPHTSEIVKFKVKSGHKLIDLFKALREANVYELFANYFKI